MSEVDYQGRRFDLCALPGARSAGESQLTQSLFVDGGAVCTGIQKLAQRWVLELLTEQGSMALHLADRGCTFMTAVRSGRLRQELDVSTEFNFSAAEVRQRLLDEETDDMPDDERLESATLQQLSLLPGTIVLSVLITSLAGDAASLVLPLPVLPINLALT